MDRTVSLLSRQGVTLIIAAVFIVAACQVLL
jgi:hypothetical protein